MGPGFTQRLKEMSTRILSGGKARQARKVDKLVGICEPIVKRMWEPCTKACTGQV
jgi:hypothetical protein